MTFAEHEEHFRLLQQVKDERNAALALIERTRAVALGMDVGPSIPEVDSLRAEVEALKAATAPPPNWTGDPAAFNGARDGWLLPASYTVRDGDDCGEDMQTGWGLAYTFNETEARAAWAPKEVAKLITALAAEYHRLIDSETP